MFRTSDYDKKGLLAIAFFLLLTVPGLQAADSPKNDAPKPGEPTDPKARKTFDNAIEWERHRNPVSAISDFRKANKQDGGHCTECLRRAYSLANEIGAYKDAEAIAREWLPAAGSDAERAAIHYRLAVALQQQGVSVGKDKYFSDSCDEFKTALELEPRLTVARFSWGVSLAHLRQDDAARAQFNAFLQEDKDNLPAHERAGRYVERIELARATMAPPFTVTTLDGQRVSMDSLAGKVVLIDFWATWCGACREALPHIRKIAQQFNGQPLVVLSVSLDSDEGKWKDFVGKNGMTWLQCRAGSFDATIPRQFNVTAIPATFTIDADGVLEDQHVGDADIEGKLKKLIARAADAASRKPAPAAAQPVSGGKPAKNLN